MLTDARLRKIGDMLDDGKVVADIGTDHAYLPIFLIKKGKIKRAIACDIAEGPCRAAISNVTTYGMKELIDVRRSDGLQAVVPGEADIITIAGMGGSTIIDILDKSPAVARTANKIFLQPMAGSASLRKWLCTNSYVIEDEELVADDKFLYEIIVARSGISEKISEVEAVVGPVLLKKKHLLLPQQFAKQISSLQTVLENMSRSECAVHSENYAVKKKLLEDLEVSACVCNCR